jgi:exopolyphosphatase/guanosine-5'-triphosphate,3'-diphosphate pyrophosphatase
MGRMRGPVAIVDIGSNSVRLVIYEAATRTPAVVHNEKAICAIGRDMVTSQRLHEGGIELALAAMARFRMLADAHKVKHRLAVATAAARDAENGREFIARAEKAWGGAIRILSGAEEARVAAEGVLAGIPEADGLVGDLGGGSLDMVTVQEGKTGRAITMPFGPLRLMDLSNGNPDKARALVDEGLYALDGLGSLRGRALYAVGGAWRSLARLDMDETGYPLHVLHDYRIPAARMLKLCKLVSGLSKKSLEKVKVISKRRAESLPYGAIVLERLLMASGLKEVVISAYGLREGVLHAQLSAEERAKDPLLEFAIAANRRHARAPAHAEELFDWLTPLYPRENAFHARIRRVACHFCDIGWRRHPDDRAMGAFDQVLTAPFSGADHRTRAAIATAVFHRYSGDEDFPRLKSGHDLLNAEDEALARRIGLAARLGFALSASAVGELPHFRLRLTSSKVILEVPSSRRAIAGDPVRKRLNTLAAAMGRKGEIRFD